MKWTKELDRRFIELYRSMTFDELAKMFNCSRSSAENKATKLGLRKLYPKSNSGCFKKDHPSWNRGKKGICIGGVQTQFKPGHTPQNWRQIGSERIDVEGYVYVKIEEPNKWQLKHRVVWEEHFGEIPEGGIVKFKDGNKQNINIDNLYLTDKAGNMLQNSIHRYPEELIDMMRNIGKLKRKIKNIENNGTK